MIRRSTGSSTRGPGERKLWDDYTGPTGRCWLGPARRAPWYVVPADNKPVRDVLVARTVTETLEAMNPIYPGATAGSRTPCVGPWPGDG